MYKTNLVIATWYGDRRASSLEYEEDKSWLLRKQIDVLNKVKHNLTQVTFVINENPNQSLDQNFEDYINIIPSYINNTKIVVLRRGSNIGISYGAFSFAFGLFRDEFDYYFFCEDDYVFIYDNFDEELINIFNNSPNCGMVTPLRRPPPATIPEHAAVGVLMTSNDICNTVWQKYGCLLHAEQSRDYGEAAQLDFSRGFVECGFKVVDTIDKYKFPFWNHQRSISMHEVDINHPYMVVPIQMLKELRY